MTATSDATLQTTQLPSWNLDDLYTGIDDPRIKRDMEDAHQKANDFKKRYEGKVEGLSADDLADAIQGYETLNEQLGRLGTYGHLLFAADMSHKAHVSFYQNIQEKISDIATLILFFTLEITPISEETMGQHLKVSKILAHYAPWLRDVRLFKKHQLSHELEKMVHEKNIASCSNWVRLYDESAAKMRFRVGKKDLTVSDTTQLFLNPDPDVRKQAAKAFSKGLKSHEDVSALILNTIAKDHEIDSRWRGYAQPISSRNMANAVEDEVVEALVSSVKKAYPQLSHRFYALKAKWLGMKQLNFWDRNAPLPHDDERRISWSEGQRIVLTAYEKFSPQMAVIGKEFFDKNWIDAALRPGKDSGAFSHPAVPSAHPYILQNYHGSRNDVMTLAHELGHGIHQMLSRDQGYLMMDTPLTLAETASIFGEMLTFQSLIESAKTKEERKSLLASKVGDALNTIVRQISFSEFERRFHDARKDHELSAEEIGDLWAKTQKESLGPAVRITQDYRPLWSYISHFYHSPFYVYAYAFGNCLVNSLYMTYKNGLPDFELKYMDMLKAGGTLRHKELLAPFALDASKPDFWDQGLELISGWIDELETL